MKLHFNVETINTPVGYARFLMDLFERRIDDVYEACEAAGKERMVYDALREWMLNEPQLSELPRDAVEALCRALAGARPTGGPTPAQDRNATLRLAAVALIQRWPHIRPTRNPTSTALSAASVLAELVNRSEESVNKVLKSVLAKQI